MQVFFKENSDLFFARSVNILSTPFTANTYTDFSYFHHF